MPYCTTRTQYLQLLDVLDSEPLADTILNILCDGDRYGNPNYKWDPSDPRFKLHLQDHDPSEEDGWRFKITVVDNKFMDSEGYPIEAIASGNNWQEAFSSAAHMVQSALDSEECVF